MRIYEGLVTVTFRLSVLSRVAIIIIEMIIAINRGV